MTKVGPAASANHNINATEATSGRVGLVLALPTGSTFPSGNHEILRVTFAAQSPAGGKYAISLGDSPVWRAVSDAAAQELETTYLNAQVSVQPNPALNITANGDNVILSWPAWAADFTLQTADSADLNWNKSVYLTETNAGTVSVTLPASALTKFFRLFHP
jgi:hypothetical protein